MPGVPGFGKVGKESRFITEERPVGRKTAEVIAADRFSKRFFTTRGRPCDGQTDQNDSNGENSSNSSSD